MNNILDILKKNGIIIENADLRICESDGYIHLFLYGNSVILDGDFGSTYIYLYDNAKIEGGTFDGYIDLYDESQIEGGIFNKWVNLYDDSNLEGGTFEDNIYLSDSSYISNGIFNSSIHLSDYSKIINGDFKTGCKVLLYTAWEYDSDTLKLLHKNGIKYENRKYESEEMAG